MSETNKDKLFREMDPGNLFKEITRLENELKLTKEERDKVKKSNIVEIVKSILHIIFISGLIFAGICAFVNLVIILTKDNTSGEHARNVSTWTARAYMRAQYPNQTYDIYCAPNIKFNDSNNYPCSGFLHFMPCNVNLTNLNRRFLICCDSDEIGSNTGCDGNERVLTQRIVNPITNRQ